MTFGFGIDSSKVSGPFPAVNPSAPYAPGAADPEMAGLMRVRRRDARRHQAQIAQIRRHPDLAEGASGLAQQRVWALRQARQRRLKMSDLAMLRRPS